MKKVAEYSNQKVSYGDLAKNYQDALKKEGFQEFIRHLHLGDEELMKYTSTLLDSFFEYEHCKHCKNLLSCKNKVTGYAYLPRVVNGTIAFEYHICKYQKKHDKDYAYLKNVFLFEVPKEIANARVDQIYGDDETRAPVIDWILNFIEQYPKVEKGLFLHGNFGCGKTYLLSAMFHELARKNVKSAILFWPEFLRDLKSSFGSDFKEKYEKVKKVPLLLIDDIGAESTTAWERDEVLSPILQYRMQEHLKTFFTSNMNMQELERHLSITKESVDVLKARRIIERIKQLTEDAEMMSENLRNKKVNL